MIQLYTGDGKGKTTAAIGQTIRAAGRGWPIVFAQFMKGNDTGELAILRRLPKIQICRSDEDFGFYRSMTDEQKKKMTVIHDQILDTLLAAAEKGTCKMIVLDEITYPVKWGLIDGNKLQRLLEHTELEIILTGRDAAPYLADKADYITEMRMLRHPYDKGISAREGIEY